MRRTLSALFNSLHFVNSSYPSWRIWTRIRRSVGRSDNDCVWIGKESEYEGYVWKRWLECCYKRLTVRTGQIKFDQSTSVSFDLPRPTNNRKVINTPCDTYKTNIKKLTALSEILRGIHIHTHTHTLLFATNTTLYEKEKKLYRRLLY